MMIFAKIREGEGRQRVARALLSAAIIQLARRCRDWTEETKAKRKARKRNSSS